MGFAFKRQKGMLHSRNFRLAVVLFIATIGFSFLDTFWSIYIDGFVKNAALVGFVSSFLAFISFISFFLIVPFIEKYDKAKTFAISLFLIAISYFVFAITSNFYLFLLIAIIVTVFHSLRITSFGIMIKDGSLKKELCVNEGIVYTFINLAWLLGPLVAGLLSNYFDISIIFGLSGFFILVSLIYFLFLRIHEEEAMKRVDKNVVKLFFDFFRCKRRVVAYMLGGGVSFWWSLIYIFVPVYMVESGLDVSYVGYFLFAVAIPLISLSYFFSRITGKVGFKKIFKIGFFIPFLASLICFFVPSIYVILLVLIVASVGLAMLEPTVEAYFFDNLKGKEDLRFYGPYNTTIDVSHFISRMVGGVVLLFFPFKYIFLFFSFSMLVFLLLSFMTLNINESRRKEEKKKKR